MSLFTNDIDVLQTLVVALGAGLGIWGVINLLEGYGQDNPVSKSQGMKQLILLPVDRPPYWKAATLLQHCPDYPSKNRKN